MSEVLSIIDINDYGPQSMVSSGGGGTEDLDTVLAAQDSALSTQVSKIAQIETALDNKIALDLQQATSDATATANDIAKDKTAYVNGIKVEGTHRDVFVVPDGMKFRSSTVSTMPQLDTSNVTNMSYMFNDCSSLTTIPLLDTSNVTNMTYMFGSCSSLTTIPQFDTSKVTNMSYMFDYCSRLTTIPLLNTSNVTDMTDMLRGCAGITNTENLQYWNTSKVINMSGLFERGTYTQLDLTNFDTSKVQSMRFMFSRLFKIRIIRFE